MTKSRNIVDTTIAEIHKTREKISDAFGGNIHAITQDAQTPPEQSGRRTVSYAEASITNAQDDQS